MKVSLFGYLDLNPYLLLYRETLEHQGIIVSLEHRFGLNWLFTRGRSCDAVHLHWVELAYMPSRWHSGGRLVRRLMNHRYVRALRGALRLADFSAALFLARLQGKAIVCTVHNLNPHNPQEFWPFVILNRAAHRVVLSTSDRVHVHNQYTLKMLETAYDCKDGVVLVPLGNFIGYYPNQVSRAAARQQLGLADESFVYLFLGLIRPYKGVEDLIGAFGEIQSPMARLLVVGRVFGDHYKEKISGLSRNDPRIKLVLEFVADETIQLYMNACDVCVLPYKHITTSSAAVLALSFGRPVIAPAITSFPELITPETGILYDPSQPDALALAMQRSACQSWHEPAIVDYARRFDWDKLGPQLAQLYQVKCDR